MVPIASYPSEPLAAPLAALFARRPESDPEVEDAVQDILRQVRKEGDGALCALTQRFDGVEVCPEQLRVPASVLAEADAALDPNLARFYGGGHSQYPRLPRAAKAQLLVCRRRRRGDAGQENHAD